MDKMAMAFGTILLTGIMCAIAGWIVGLFFGDTILGIVSLAIGGTALSAYGQYESGEASKAALSYQAQVAANNARMAAQANPTTMTGEREMAEWQPIETAPEDTVVRTIIVDAHGERNDQRLKRRGRLWWFEDDSMYVYYTPTHWKPAPPPAQSGTERE